MRWLSRTSSVSPRPAGTVSRPSSPFSEGGSTRARSPRFDSTAVAKHPSPMIRGGVLPYARCSRAAASRYRRPRSTWRTHAISSWTDASRPAGSSQSAGGRVTNAMPIRFATPRPPVRSPGTSAFPRKFTGTLTRKNPGDPPSVRVGSPTRSRRLRNRSPQHQVVQRDFPGLRDRPEGLRFVAGERAAQRRGEVVDAGAVEAVFAVLDPHHDCRLVGALVRGGQRQRRLFAEPVQADRQVPQHLRPASGEPRQATAALVQRAPREEPGGVRRGADGRAAPGPPRGAPAHRIRTPARPSRPPRSGGWRR